MPGVGQPTLVRAIGRWSLAALTINCIIGSGVFGLPSVIAELLGKRSPLAWIFAAFGTALVMACFAEVSSRFDRSGGVYLYTRTAFGRSFGIAIAWIGWLTRLTAAAANANLFIIYLGEFWTGAKTPLARLLILTILLAFLTAVNYVGVRSGTTQSNLFTAAKLVTLGAFILASLLYVALTRRTTAVLPTAASTGTWLHSILLLMFAYGGYETALMVGGEAKDPRRDYPVALLVALVVCAAVYTTTQWIVIAVVPQTAMTERPVATAAQLMFGPWSARLISVGVLISCYGYLSANTLGFPRILYAQAEHRDMPSFLAGIHPKYRTPYIAIVIFGLCLWMFSLIGSFQWNITVSAMARLFYYGSVSAALPVLRHRREVPAAEFHLPLGEFVAVLAIVTSMLLFPRLDRTSAAVLTVVALCVVVNSLWAARRQTQLRQAPGVK
ncbi:MAG: APC family permease [Acidobacteria bacterium]|nr:APC family permease [Acidobacteriota bacterium]